MNQPTLIRLASILGLDTDSCMDFVCLAGAAIAFLATVLPANRNTVSFALLWFLYFSVYQVCSLKLSLFFHIFLLILIVQVFIL